MFQGISKEEVLRGVGRESALGNEGGSMIQERRESAPGEEVECSRREG